MDIGILKMFVTNSKVGGWVRAAVASGFVLLIHKYPVLGPVISPEAQTEIATGLATIAVGAWSHYVKS